MEQSMIMTSDEFTNLYVKNGKILPNTVTEITDSLDLSDKKISVIENLPNTINGALALAYNNISVIENLPTNLINNLYLHNNPIYKQYIIQSKYKSVKQWAYAYLMKKKLDAWNNL